MINSILLRNFRNHNELKLEFNSKFVYINGPNGSGKTSILEAIHYIATTKSHRTNNDLETIKNNEEFALIKLDTNSTKYNLVISNKGKIASINNKEVSKLSEFIGKLKVVMFAPEDLNIIKGSPLIRRNFMDLELMKINKSYLSNLSKYKNILKQRNSLLKTIDFKDEFTFLDILGFQLYESGIRLMNVRKEFINSLNERMIKIYKNFSKNKIELFYIPNISEESFLNHIKRNQKTDILYKTTNVGPHRDEFGIKFNNSKANQASQGEIRLIVISLKLALLKLIEETTNSDVVLLLDDVLSELDSNIQNTFLNELPEDIQVIMNSAIKIKNNKIQVIELKENVK